MKKTVAISTFCVWTSYGSILQSFALKRALMRLRIDSYVFMDEPGTNPYRFTSLNGENGLKGLVVSGCMRLNRDKIISRYEKTNKFITEYLDVVEYNDYQDLLNNIPDANFYLSGSDQVFNPIILRPAFFLDFVEDKTRCFSYACSMGETKVPQEKEILFSQLINNFKTISCREEDIIPILRKYNPNAKYYNHIDPTFLLARSEWEKIMIPYAKITRPYILVFPIYWDSKINRKLKTIHDTMGIDIVTICNDFNRAYGNIRLWDVSVNEFLWLINHAEGVVSSSFHGVALSLILNKNLAAVVNPRSPSRIMCLLNKLDAKTLEIEELITGKMSYNVINKKIAEQKDKGMEYLEGIFCE